MAEAGDEGTSDRDDDAEPTGALSRIRTAVTEAAGVVVDAVLDAI